MRDIKIEEVINDGFNIDKNMDIMQDNALISLKIALKAYFSTYKAIDYDLNISSSLARHEVECEQYMEMYTECIVHFQQFFELAFKNILRQLNELLILQINQAKQYTLIMKAMNGEILNEEDILDNKTIDFIKSIELIKLLSKQGKLDSKYDFVFEERSKFEALNSLRNKAWHKGIYVMNYTALDKFIGECILPLVVKTAQIMGYNFKSWKYDRLNCRLDPLNEIILEAEGKGDIGKIAFLKELGRAAYKLPIGGILGGVYSGGIKRAQAIAKQEIYNREYFSGRDICKCPVCGIESMVEYTTSLENGRDYTEALVCYACSFELHNNGLKNPKEYGYTLPDYWRYW